MKTYHDLLTQLRIAYAHPGGKETTEKWLDNQDISNMKNILEVGCGVGETIRYLRSKTNAAIYGIDISSEMVAISKEQSKDIRNVKIKQADVTSLPFASSFFDLIISESVLTFTQIKQAMQEITRCLKPNGKLILLEMVHTNDLSLKGQEEIKHFYQLPNLYSLTDWKKSLSNHRYKDIAFHQVNKSSSTAPLNQALDEKTLDILNEHFHLSEKYEDQLLAYLFTATKRGDER
ncbi:class I SAM-dependent methyltransferase [Gracilibacillus kekensis]|uniref:Tocopherol O-methyltransferase n=1 Tax=Gracilibacillus kekensis TaxID=1027249 RepID=A0A1M7L092_9BACI|nr:class I SAM-dependent methyltransferase [Gracilibacillus kekensis]SHM71250.1 tocopherol O-methyltransferase [Gracilibacillus kekensis]